MVIVSPSAQSQYVKIMQYLIEEWPKSVLENPKKLDTNVRKSTHRIQTILA